MANKAKERGETVLELPLSELRDFHNHPFKIRDDDSMKETIESVNSYGVLVPGIARPHPEGGYEIISGHRRRHASELSGRETMPFIIRDLDDDTATVIMVDSNIHRENILPSERAFAYKMKLDAIKRQAGRPTKGNAANVGTQKRSDQILAEELGESRNQIQRYIRLTELTPELLDMTDTGAIGFNSAVELSFLKKEEQAKLVDAMEYAQATPSQAQAKYLKAQSKTGTLTGAIMKKIMSEEKKGEPEKVTLSSDTLRKYFPKSYTPLRMQETIIKLLEQWQKKRQQQQDR